MKRLIHDVAWATTSSIMEKIEGVFRPEEKNDARGLIYEAICQALEMAFAARAKELAKLNPSRN